MMIEPWNDVTILPPPIHTFQCKHSIDITDLRNTCTDIIRILVKQSPLHKESVVLSCFVYKFDRKFRNDIGFRKLRQVKVGLHRYLSLNIIKDIENFSLSLPTNTEDFYLPTRQLLEYILVRLITFSKLMLRIYICTKQAAIFYLDRVKRGESHWMSLMPYAVLSRIWSMVSVLLQHAFKWYTKLYSFLPQLELKGIPFLKNGYELPSNLEEWINIKNLDDQGRYQWGINKLVEVIPILVDNDDNDNFDLFKYVKDVNKDMEVDSPTENDCKGKIERYQPYTIKLTDQGEPMSRKGFATAVNLIDNNNKAIVRLKHNINKIEKQHLLLSNKNEDLSEKDEMGKINVVVNAVDSNCLKDVNIRNNEYYIKESMNPLVNHAAETITNTDNLKKFIIKEEYLRNKNAPNALTNHLSLMQWHALKHNLFKLSNISINNKKITQKFNKIWKEKCLDYLE